MTPVLLLLFAVFIAAGASDICASDSSLTCTTILFSCEEYSEVESDCESSCSHSDSTASCCGGYAYHAGLLKNRVTELESNNTDVLILNAGDFLGVSDWQRVYNGTHMVSLMNIAGYMATSVQAWEVRFSTEVLKSLIDMSDFTYVAANLEFLPGSNVDDVIYPYAEIEMQSGRRAGVIGITDPKLVGRVDPTLLKHVSVKPSLPAVAKAVDELRDNGVEFIVLLGSLADGSDEDETDDILESVKGIDAWILNSRAAEDAGVSDPYVRYASITGDGVVFAPSLDDMADGMGLVELTIATRDEVFFRL
eukprot:Rmarinus@m.7317